MQCPSCGSPIVSGGAFCENCGADVRGQQPAAAPYAPQPAAAPYAPQPGQPYAQQPAYGQQPYPPVAPAKRSSGKVVGVVIAVVLVAAALCVGGYLFATGAFAPKTPPGGPGTPSAAATTTAPSTAVTTPSTVTTTPDAVVTDAEARSVVTAFMEARLAMDVAASKTYCSAKFLAGEMKPLIDDKYWRPDSYQITKLTPDLMYIHVTVMGDWPSGREATIYSVWRDPDSGKVVIDGFLDPQFFPELVTP
jgi:hypothetical protein